MTRKLAGFALKSRRGILCCCPMTNSCSLNSNQRARSNSSGWSSPCTKSWFVAILCDASRRRCKDRSCPFSLLCRTNSGQSSLTGNLWFLKLPLLRPRHKKVRFQTAHGEQSAAVLFEDLKGAIRKQNTQIANRAPNPDRAGLPGVGYHHFQCHLLWLRHPSRTLPFGGQDARKHVVENSGYSRLPAAAM
jgi:hypothetical protein